MAKKSSKPRVKTLYYRRAKWDGSDKETLQTILEDAFTAHQTIGARAFALAGNVQLRAESVKDSGNLNEGGLLVHITRCNPGEPTSTINQHLHTPEGDVYVEDAPKGKDFMDSDLFALVVENHIVVCPSGMRENNFVTYVEAMLKKVKRNEIVRTLQVERVAKVSKVELIQSEGVKEIEFKASMYEASLQYAEEQGRSAKTSEFTAKAAGLFSSVFGKDRGMKDIQKDENLDISLTVRVDGRKQYWNRSDAAFGDVGKKRLRSAAEDVIHDLEADDLGDVDGFVIVTNNDNRITAEEIRVSSQFKISAHGKSVSRAGAFDALEKYFLRLKKNGILSQ